MIEKKYKSPQIGTMTEAQISAWTKSLLLKIHVITGWTIPATDLLIILVDQFQKKLIESYPDINPDEIEFAFRQAGTTVKDWGKAMNLSLIDEVLIPYLDERKRLSHAMEERNAAPEPEKIYSQEEIDNENRKLTEQLFQQILSGRVPYGIPDYVKEILVKDNLIHPDTEISQWLVYQLGCGIKSIYTNK